jgi:hypothetical protein
LVEEDFVQGSSEIIDEILKDFGVFNGAHRGIDLYFTIAPQDETFVKISKVEDLYDGWATYRYKDSCGDLCPVTEMYLGTHPSAIWVKPVKEPFKVSFVVSKN